jgi:hypothetical protein
MLKSPIAIAAVTLAILPAKPYAQSIWNDRGGLNSVTLELSKPKFERSGFSGLAAFLTLQMALTDRALLVAELPYAHSRREYYSESGRTDDAIGNIYLGAEIRPEDSPGSGEFGIRLPTASTDHYPANSAGMLADHDRLEAFLVDRLVISGRYNYRPQYEDGFATRFHIGPSILVYTGEENRSSHGEVYLHYSVQPWYKAEKISFGVGLSGAMNVSAGNPFSGHSTEFQIGLAAVYDAGRVRPGVNLRLPLTDYLDDSLDFVFSFSLQFLLE